MGKMPKYSLRGLGNWMGGREVRRVWRRVFGFLNVIDILVISVVVGGYC